MADSSPHPLAVVTSPRFADHRLPEALAHRTGGHPERPERIQAVNQTLDALDLPVLPLGDPADDATLQLVHTPRYVETVHLLAAAGGDYLDAGETYLGPDSDVVARLAVAAGITAADAVIDGHARRAFAAVRPPGHHALRAQAMGFCVFANLAIVARHLQKNCGVNKIAVIDFDVHHGNGTQAIFYDDPSVLTVSLHGDPRTLWPGSGFAGETGEGRGVGTCLNIPLPAGTGDEDYLAALREVALPAVRSFGPEILLVSAGFDAATRDLLANLKLTSEGFGTIGAELATLADELCEGRLVAMLEGGYDLTALREGVTAFLASLS